MAAVVVYESTSKKTSELATEYLRTHGAPHRYLAYRDIPKIFSEFVVGKKILDFGAGTGASAEFLHRLGFDVTGVDISQKMLDEARTLLPDLTFCHVEDLSASEDFDLVFSSFVLLELASKDEITTYLSKAHSFLKAGGVFVGITASEKLYQHHPTRKWMTFDTDFVENRSLSSGNITKLVLKDPRFEFHDYFWKEADYVECFRESGFEVLRIHSPIGRVEEPYDWERELEESPYKIFIARKLPLTSALSSIYS